MISYFFDKLMCKIKNKCSKCLFVLDLKDKRLKRNLVFWCIIDFLVVDFFLYLNLLNCNFFLKRKKNGRSYIIVVIEFFILYGMVVFYSYNINIL